MSRARSSPVPGVVAVWRQRYDTFTGPKASFFRGTHKVRDDLQLSHFVG